MPFPGLGAFASPVLSFVAIKGFRKNPNNKAWRFFGGGKGLAGGSLGESGQAFPIIRNPCPKAETGT